MVLVVFTRAGFDEMRQLIAAANAVVWVNGGVLSDQEVAAVRKAGVDLTTFSSAIDQSDPAELEEALSVVALHHPGDRLWVELQAE